MPFFGRDKGRFDAADASTIAGVAGLGVGLFTSPLRSKLFLLALVGTLAGAGVLARERYLEGAADTEWAWWALRVGGSFVAAFVFAYLVRRAVVAAFVIGGALIAGAVLLNKFGAGISDAQLDAINDHVSEGAEAIETAANSAWTTIKTYLPSGGAAGAGLFSGSRHAGRTPQA